MVGRLEDANLVIRDETGAIRPRDPSLLLDAWPEEYDFEKHRILRGHIATCSGDALLRAAAETLDEFQLDCRIRTRCRLADYSLCRIRLVSLYLREEPSASLLDGLSFPEEERGANSNIGRAIGVTDKTVAKAFRWRSVTMV